MQVFLDYITIHFKTCAIEQLLNTKQISKGYQFTAVSYIQPRLHSTASGLENNPAAHIIRKNAQANLYFFKQMSSWVVEVTVPMQSSNTHMCEGRSMLTEIVNSRLLPTVHLQ